MEEYYAIINKSTPPSVVAYYYSSSGIDLTKPGSIPPSSNWVHVMVPVSIRSSRFMKAAYDEATQTYSVIVDEDARQRFLSEQWAQLREQRNKKLMDSDWAVSVTDIMMSSEKRGEWIRYRQALRDLPSTLSDPDLVVWPTKP